MFNVTVTWQVTVTLKRRIINRERGALWLLWML